MSKSWSDQKFGESEEGLASLGLDLDERLERLEEILVLVVPLGWPCEGRAARLRGEPLPSVTARCYALPPSVTMRYYARIVTMRAYPI